MKWAQNLGGRALDRTLITRIGDLAARSRLRSFDEVTSGAHVWWLHASFISSKLKAEYAKDLSYPAKTGRSSSRRARKYLISGCVVFDEP